MKKRILLAFCFLGMNLVYIQDAQAAGTITISNCTIATTDFAPRVGLVAPALISLKDYLAGQLLSPTCKNVAIKHYKAQANLLGSGKTNSDLTSFNKRFDSCTGGAGISLNPKSWFIGLKCIMSVSFMPTSNAFKDSYNSMLKEFKTHQPTSYIAVATNTFGGVVTNWGGMTCSTGIPYKFRISGQVVDLTLNCSPPTAIQKLYKFMILGLWIGFALMLYQIVNRKLSQLT
jgi:hypothetical protein